MIRTATIALLGLGCAKNPDLGSTRDSSPPNGLAEGPGGPIGPGDLSGDLTPSFYGIPQKGDVALGEDDGVIRVEWGERTVEPSVIEVDVAQPITIIVANGGARAHDFHIQDLAVHTDPIAVGSEVEVNLLPTVAGSYPFGCLLPGHPQDLHGTLVVR